MADTFSNDLRLRLQESGSNAGTWGALLNGTITNIASALGQGSEAIPNASSHTITLADGTADEARSLYLKCTGGGQACTVTLGPNTISKVWIIDNATSYTLTFSQGSGANVAIAAGAVKVIATDGAGSGAAVVDTLDGLEGSMSTLAVSGGLTVDTDTLLVDATNNRVGIGITPSKKLTVFGTGVGNATVQIEGEGGADPYINFLTNNTQHWSLGVDDSDADKFKLSEHSALGTNDYLTVDVTGKVDIGSGASISPDADAANLVIQENGAAGITIGSSASSIGSIRFADSGSPRAGMIYYNHVGNEMRFYTNANERARLDSSGSLLINSTATADTGGIKLFSNSGVNAAPATSGTTQTGGALRLRGANNAVLDMGLNSIYTWIQATDKVSLAQGYSLSLNPNGGNVGIGTFNTQSKLDVLNTVGNVVSARITSTATSTTEYGPLIVLTNDPNDTVRYLLAGGSASTNRFVIYSNGNIKNQNNSYTGISDEKLKENIVDAGSQWDDIKALRVRKYSFKEEEASEPTQIGVIAQEVEAAGMSGLVYETADQDTAEDGSFVDTGEVTKTMKYSILYMKAVKALQEAMTRIETLEAKVQTLENN